MKSAMQNFNTIAASSDRSNCSSVIMSQLLLNDHITSWETLGFCALTGGLALLSLIYILLDTKFTFLSIRRNPRNQIPGPWGFPVLGHLPLLGAMPHLTLMDWLEKYGKVFQIRLGFRKAIVVNSSKLIRETLIQRGTEFAGRPNFPSFKLVNNGQGMIFNSYSPIWQVKRTLMQKAVSKYLTNGSQYLHSALHEHADAMIEELIKTPSDKNSGVDPATTLLRHSSRLFFNILISDFQVDKEARHEQVDELIQHFHSVMKLSSYTALSDIYPALQIFFPRQLEEFRKINAIITNNLRNEQLASLKTFDPEITRDITDGLMMAKESIAEEDLRNAGLLDCNENSRTLALLGDLLGAGQSTVASTLKWLLLHMAAFPEIQNKVREEIIRNFSDESDFLDAKVLHRKYTYCVATVLESQRFAVLFPMLVPHATTVDTEIDGYKVKKNTIVIFNIWSASRDSEEWSEAEKFKPERFLSEDASELNKNRLHAFPAFGIGRRRCLGEQLGVKAVSYFFLRIMKSCRISLPPNTKPPSLSGVFGFSLEPDPYKLIIESTD